MPVRAEIPFLAIVTHLVITQHGPEGRLFGPRFVFTLHSDPSVSLCYQVPSEVAEGLVLQAENRKEEAPEMCSDSPEHLSHPRAVTFAFGISHFSFSVLGNRSELAFNFKRMTFLASFHLNLFPLRMCYLLEVEGLSKVCVLTAWSSVAGPSKCFREWGWRKQDTGDVPSKGVGSLILS